MYKIYNKQNISMMKICIYIYIIYTSLQNVADSTNAVGSSPILPLVKSVGVGRRRGKASATLVGHQPGDQPKVTNQT